MRVTFVYKYLTLGGVEAVLRARLERLPALGIEADAWFLHDLGGRAIFRGLEERIAVGTAEECVRRARAEGTDLLVSIDTEELVAPVGAAGLPWLLECHSGYVENLGYLERLAVAPPRAVLVPSQEQRQLIADRLPVGLPLAVVPNALAAAFAGALVPFPAPPAQPVLAWIGRLDVLKDWPAALAITRLLREGGLPVELWIVGRPTHEAGARELREEATREGVLPALRWLAGLPHDAMPRLLDAVRDSGGLALSTSRRESFGLAIAEAMARGCAVLVPDQEPFRELVPETACRYAPGSRADAARRARALLVDRALRERVAQAGRETVLARCAPEVALGALAAALRDALVRRG
jgi:glycosyltransferase involved in cell wall biosynthesis